MKARREASLDDRALLARFDERLMRRLLPEIDRVFAFRVSKREPVKLISYEAGAGYFRPHRDNDSRDTAHRRFALTLNLNTGATSYHLRQLAQHGFVAEDAERGNARERWWAATHQSTTTGPEAPGDTEGAELLDAYLQAVGCVQKVVAGVPGERHGV